MIRVRITAKGQITLPKMVREYLQVQTGDSLQFELGEDCVSVRPLRRPSILEFRGIFARDEEIEPQEARRSAREARARRRLEQLEAEEREIERRDG